MHKICDDEFGCCYFFIPDLECYMSVENGKTKWSMKGDNLPDPYVLWKKRRAKWKEDKTANAAARLEDENIPKLEPPRLRPHKVVFDLYEHWDKHCKEKACANANN